MLKLTAGDEKLEFTAALALQVSRTQTIQIFDDLKIFIKWRYLFYSIDYLDWSRSFLSHRENIFHLQPFAYHYSSLYFQLAQQSLMDY